MKRKIYNFIYPWVPFVVFILLIGAVTNLGKLKLSETPEIEGSNSATWTNSADSTWISKGPITTGNDISDFAATSGINFVEVALLLDTIDVSSITIRDETTSDRSLCFINLFRDYPPISGAEDSFLYVVKMDTLAGRNMFVLSFEIAPTKSTETLWYNYFIIE